MAGYIRLKRDSKDVGEVQSKMSMWAFHGNLWAKGDTFWGTSDLKAHPLGNSCPELGSPTYTRTVDRIRTRAFRDPSDTKARMFHSTKDDAHCFTLKCFQRFQCCSRKVTKRR
ncbi:hypothetical protein E2C01_046056 [Portunus trituberculatus]|uniref:Uncharacterized protein n=1 Tax=Portunus trituberculatus TaxID=210409 RepID=A0A5B7G4K3_PORTR|nr:hypothetical protein [Portunus trituberculatus]